MAREMLTVLGLILLASSASAWTVTLNPDGPIDPRNPAGSDTYLLTRVRYGTPPVFKTRSYFPTALPEAASESLSADGNNNFTLYDFSNSGFEIIVDHARGNVTSNTANSYGWITFRVDENVDYLIEGSYAAVDPDGRPIYQGIHLLDITTDTFVFRSLQGSVATPNELFTVGLREGDSTNSHTGSTWGTLIAGHNYMIHYDVLIALPTQAPSSEATAGGFFRITFLDAGTCQSEDACSNCVDDDGDGRIDLGDPGCDDEYDDSERSNVLPCDNGLDDDGDGWSDFDPVTAADPLGLAGVGDPGCGTPNWAVEDPHCQDGIDNDPGSEPGPATIDFDGGASLDLDQDGFVDAAFNAAMPAVGTPDPQCLKPWTSTEVTTTCGLGFELTALLAPVWWLRSRRRAD